MPFCHNVNQVWYLLVKASVKQVITEIRNRSTWWLCCYLITFYQKQYLQNLKYNVKRACIFHLILLGIQSSLILSVQIYKMVEFGNGTKISVENWTKRYCQKHQNNGCLLVLGICNVYNKCLTKNWNLHQNFGKLHFYLIDSILAVDFYVIPV